MCSVRSASDQPASKRHAPPAVSARTRKRSSLFAAILITIPIGLLAVLVGIVVDSHHRDRMQTEMRDLGRQRVLAIRTLGKKIYQDFLDPQIGDGDGYQYQLSKEAKEMRRELGKIRDADPNIRAIAIYASQEPTANPRGVVLYMGEPVEVDCRMSPFMDGEVLGYKSFWPIEGTLEEALVLRAPISGSDGQFTATANLVLSVESFKRDAKTMRTWILIFGLVFVGAGFAISFVLVSRARQ